MKHVVILAILTSILLANHLYAQMVNPRPDGSRGTATSIGASSNTVPNTVVTQRVQQYESTERSTLNLVGRTFSALDYGCVPDDSTDNSPCIARMFTAGNASTVGHPTYLFPCEVGVGCIYKYTGSSTSPIHPIIASTISCGGTAGFDYAGRGHAMDLGVRGGPLSTGYAQPFEVEGCTFTGGANQTAGIYTAPFNLVVNIHDNKFLDYGNNTHYDILFPGDGNWNPTVAHNTWVDTGGTTKGLWVDAHGASNLYLKFIDNDAFCGTNGAACTMSSSGPAIWVGSLAFISHNNMVSAHAPLLRISQITGAGEVQIDHNNFECAQRSNCLMPAITFGDPTRPGIDTSCMNISDNYIFWAAGSGVSPIGVETPTSGSDRIVNCIFSNNFISAPTGTSQPYIFTNGYGYNTWNGPVPAAASGVTPAHPLFDIRSGFENVGAVWNQTNYGSSIWQLNQPITGQSILTSQDRSTVLTATPGGSAHAVCLAVGITYYWCVDGQTHNFGAVNSKGQHFITQAADNDLFGTCSAGSGTTCSVTFTTNYLSTPSCVVTPTFAAKSFYISSQAKSGFTITYAPTGASSFNYHCGGNPN